MKKVFLGLFIAATMMSFSNTSEEVSVSDETMVITSEMTVELVNDLFWCTAQIYSGGRIVGFGQAETCARAYQLAINSVQ